MYSSSDVAAADIAPYLAEQVACGDPRSVVEVVQVAAVSRDSQHARVSWGQLRDPSAGWRSRCKPEARLGLRCVMEPGVSPIAWSKAVAGAQSSIGRFRCPTAGDVVRDGRRSARGRSAIAASARGCQRLALREGGEDRLAETLQERQVSLAQLRPLLVCQTAEHVEAGIEPGQGNPDVRADATSARDLEIPHLLVGLSVWHHIRESPREQAVTVGVFDRHRRAGTQSERVAVACQVAHDFAPVTYLTEDGDVHLGFRVSELERPGHGVLYWAVMTDRDVGRAGLWIAA
jgi:hypothetical protein